MARKKLLTEGEVRQFMKLADLGPLSENYFSNNPLFEQPEEEEEFAAAEVGPEGGEELELGAVEDEVPLDDAGLEGEEDLGGEEGGGAEDLVMGLLQAVQGWAEEQGVDMELDGDEEGGEEEVEDVEAVELEEPGGEEELELGAAEEEEVPVPGNYDLSEGWAGDIGTVKPRKPQRRSKMGTKEDPGALGAKPELGGGAGNVGTDEDDWFLNLDDEEREAMKEAHFAKRDASHREEIVAEVARRVAQRLSADKQKETVAEQLAERIFERLTSK